MRWLHDNHRRTHPIPLQKQLSRDKRNIFTWIFLKSKATLQTPEKTLQNDVKRIKREKKRYYKQYIIQVKYKQDGKTKVRL